MKVPNVLAIGGSDPSGGAGIQADVRTITALGAYACAAITLLTAQNNGAVTAVWKVPGRRVRAQLETLLAEVSVQAIKIGALGSRSTARVVAEVLEGLPELPVVLDPVHRASAGPGLLDRGARGVLLERLVPRATLLTPNLLEAASLTETGLPGDVAGMQECARRLLALGARAVLLKGGHLPPNEAGDVVDIYADSSRVEELRGTRIAGGPFHGSGCVLASAAAVALARGETPFRAALAARQVVRAGMEGAVSLQAGGGPRPLWPLARLEGGRYVDER
ncbi:MAG TPA: bifunctional hydroxymethylpyrimidine kinase/phosphomethylpyrimidine kinase [Gemmatimonadaceae bacterium]|nr:bifunctional hydroxymethylpyrimidine kinase/phosphomethylpyrimidine kinase [Gemmatimonadaceae bacterium]